MTDKEKIAEVLKFSGMNQSKFARTINVSQSNLFNVLDPKKPNKPGMSIVKGILKAFSEINPAWLVSDATDMLLPDNPKTETTESLREQVEAYKEIIRQSSPDVAKRLGLLDDVNDS